MTGAPVIYIPNFISSPDEVFSRLWDDLAWVNRTPRRKEYWTNIYDRPYTYGNEVTGGTYDPQPSHPLIAEISELLVPQVGFLYEACFLNGYPESRSGLEWHADSSPEINHERPIAVVTVGGARAIQFKTMEHGSPVEEVMLEPGSLLLMKPGMQSTHFHRIPKAGYVTKPRVSLTFRSLLP